MLYLSLSYYLRLTSWSRLFYIGKKSSHSTMRSSIFEEQLILSKHSASWHGRKEWFPNAVITTTRKSLSDHECISYWIYFSKMHLLLKVTRPLSFYSLDENLTSRKIHRIFGESCLLYKDDRWEIVLIVRWVQPSKLFSLDRSG